MTRPARLLVCLPFLTLSCIQDLAPPSLPGDALAGSCDNYWPAQTGLHPADEFLRQTVARDLGILQEPCLPTGNQRGFRFFWRRSLDSVIVVRIEDREAYRFVVAKIIALQDLTAPHRLPGLPYVTVGPRYLSTSEWQRFEEALAQSDFWGLPDSTYSPGTDGADWFFEGSDAGRHRALLAWSPRHGGPYARLFDLGLAMLEAAGLSVTSERVY